MIKVIDEITTKNGWMGTRSRPAMVNPIMARIDVTRLILEIMRKKLIRSEFNVVIFIIFCSVKVNNDSRK